MLLASPGQDLTPAACASKRCQTANCLGTSSSCNCICWLILIPGVLWEAPACVGLDLVTLEVSSNQMILCAAPGRGAGIPAQGQTLLQV